ncbi:origin recognition complex subunit 5-like [Schistocerca gregaria]|uniref:origin recognition complex subunit 5-like n=1 Tax=Schistocerca gregaria TaxID=7010 RepID=UPI00211F1963|nr:origin recognition complex subunit 5-like [Schistocerca gregaria]
MPIYIYGNPEIDKLELIMSIFSESNAVYCMVQCFECYYSRRLFFETVLRQLVGFKFNAVDGELSNVEYFGPGHSGRTVSCSSWFEFIEQLRNVVQRWKRPKAFIVLNEIERLCSKTFSYELLMGLVRLGELVGENVNVVMIGDAIWEDVAPEVPSEYLMTLVLPRPSPAQLSALLSKEVPALSKEEVPPSLDDKQISAHYTEFCDMLCKSLSVSYVSFTELKRAVRMLFPAYLRPLFSSTLGENTFSRLYTLFSPNLAQLRRYNLAQICVDYDSKYIGVQQQPNRLPTLSKYIIVASWLASYRPEIGSKEDLRKQKKEKHVTVAEQESMMGMPKPFKLKKLISLLGIILEGYPGEFSDDREASEIFGALQTSTIPSQFQILQLISILVELRLLVQLGGRPAISSIKFQCAVDHAMAFKLSEEIEFPIRGFL